jgi:hypothetical protein
MTARAIMPSTEVGTPETYLNPDRQQGFYEPLQPGTQTYSAPALSSFSLNDWALSGRWTVGSESITPTLSPASILGAVQAQNVYLVMTSTGGVPRRGRVLLGGKPIPAAERGADVGPGGWFTVRAQRLYNLVKLGKAAPLLLTVQLPHGVKAYDFTFG